MTCVSRGFPAGEVATSERLLRVGRVRACNFPERRETNATPGGESSTKGLRPRYPNRLARRDFAIDGKGPSGPREEYLPRPIVSYPARVVKRAKPLAGGWERWRRGTGITVRVAMYALRRCANAGGNEVSFARAHFSRVSE